MILVTLLSALQAHAALCDLSAVAKIELEESVLKRQVEIIDHANAVAQGTAGSKVSVRVPKYTVAPEKAEDVVKMMGTKGADLIPDLHNTGKVYVQRGNVIYEFDLVVDGQKRVFTLRQVRDSLPKNFHEANPDVFEVVTGRLPNAAENSFKTNQLAKLNDEAKTLALPTVPKSSGTEAVQDLAKKGEYHFRPQPMGKEARLERTTMRIRDREYEGYLDEFGNLWTKGPTRTKGEAFEWDVQVADGAPKWIKDIAKDGTHINVSLTGKVTH
jgi:hypothetical protein